MNSGEVVNKHIPYGAGQLSKGAFHMELMRHFPSCGICKRPFVGPVGSKVGPCCQESEEFKDLKRAKHRAMHKRRVARKKAEKAAKEATRVPTANNAASR